MSGCFCYLVNHTPQAIADGARSLALLQRHYLDQHQTPVIIFHEAGLTAEMRETLGCPSATCVALDFSSYPTVPGLTTTGSWSLGYRHMCRFFANEWFHHPALAAFDYCCRLDTDSFILAPMADDLFVWMAETQTRYGFLNDRLIAPPAYRQGLWPLAQQFIASHPEIPVYAQSYRDIPDGGLYYTNFEVCDLAWFRGQPWREFFSAVDTSGGIYAHRWGDHVIRYVGVRSFLPPSAIRQVPGIHYSHQGIGAARAA